MSPPTSRRFETGIASLIGLAICLLMSALVIATLAGMRSHFIAVGETQGETQERARWEARQAEAEKQARATFDENLHIGNLAAARQLTAAQAARSYAERLAQERRHATLIVPTTTHDCNATSDPAAAADPAATGSPRLSTNAVRLWNSALAGHDVPAGACGADAAAGEACAADSGLTAEDAWDNQAANALSCSVDRGRLTALQDYLRRVAPASR